MSWPPTRTRSWPDWRARAADGSVAGRPSALRFDPKHAAVVVVDPDRAEADAEPDREADDVQPRHEPPCTRVDLIDVPRAFSGDPDGAERDLDADRRRLVQPRR